MRIYRMRREWTLPPQGLRRMAPAMTPEERSDMRFWRLRQEGPALQVEIGERAFVEQVWEVVTSHPLTKAPKP